MRSSTLGHCHGAGHKRPVLFLSLIVSCGLLLAACGGDRGQKRDPPPPFLHAALENSAAACSLEFTFIEGDWVEDYGDASFYGLGYYARMSAMTGDATALTLSEVSAERSLRMIQEESIVSAQGSDVLMSALGLMEYMDALGDTSNLTHVDALLDEIVELLELLNYYVPLDMSDMPYGPTSITALVGLTFLQRAYLLGDKEPDRAAGYLEAGVATAEELHRRTWNGTYYRFSGSKTDLYLYPNIAMISLNSRLYQLTGDEIYRLRALLAHEGIQPLRVTPESGLVGPGRYRSPYTAPSLTADYTTLSSQNYLILALMLLYEITGEADYLLQIDPVLSFIWDYLAGTWCLSMVHYGVCDPACPDGEVCVAGSCRTDQCSCGLLHHWLEGRPAEPQDDTFFCSGCNLQLSYILWYRQHAL